MYKPQIPCTPYFRPAASDIDRSYVDTARRVAGLGLVAASAARLFWYVYGIPGRLELRATAGDSHNDRAEHENASWTVYVPFRVAPFPSALTRFATF